MPTVAYDKIVLARAAVFKAMRYFASGLTSLVPVPEPGLGTMGVTANGVLYYDPETVEKEWSLDELAGVLLHEVLHVVHRHAHRVAGRDPSTWNIAVDMVVNPTVRESGFSLPKGSYFPETFGFRQNLSADEYYALLVKRGGAGGAGSGSGPSMGRCGGCAGNPGPHDERMAQQGRAPSELDRMRRQLAEAVRRAAGAGGVPSSLSRWADTQLEPPKVRWQDRLARLVSTGSTWTSGMVAPRYTRPSRRQAGLGFGPGRPVMPCYQAPLPRVAVAIDTSGSMGPSEMVAAVSETKGILSAVHAAIELLTCDAAVAGAGRVRDWQQIPGLLKGGGGTCFMPIFAELAKRKEQPEVLVFITDGGHFDNLPASSPLPGTQVLWLLVGKHAISPRCSWGERIWIDEAAQKGIAA